MLARVHGDERAITERLLTEAFATKVQIAGSAHLGDEWAPVRRLELDNGSTVVIKGRRRAAGPWGDEAAALNNERRGLEYVAGLGIDVAPRILAADDESGLVLMTDVGRGPTVQDLLLGDDTVGATTGLVELARTIGILHAASANEEHSRTWRRRTTLLDRTFEYWPTVRTAATDLGFTTPVGVSDDLEAMASALADPRFHVFVQGDLGPNNTVLAADRARLVDFEGSGFRHFALDAASLRLPFPAYGHWAVLPADVIRAMDRTYRAELAQGWPEALADEAYEAGIATGCAAWAIIRAHRLPVIAASGKLPEQALRRRTQIVQTLTSFAEIAARAERYPSLARWCLVLVDEMRDRWEEARQPPRCFRAFSG